MQVTERLLKYISADTTSDPHSDTFPSTHSQLDFAASLAKEMKQMGLKDVSLDSYGYVFGTIPSTIENYQGKILGFIAHMDTSSQASGKNIHPKIIEKYNGVIDIKYGDKKFTITISFFNQITKLVIKNRIKEHIVNSNCKVIKGDVRTVLL